MNGTTLAPRLIKTPRSPNWQIYVPGAHGVPAFKKSTRTPDPVEARRKLVDSRVIEISRAAQSDALTKGFFARLVVGKNVTVGKARDEYSAHLTLIGRSTDTITTYITAIDHWIRFARLGSSPLAVVRGSHIAPFVNGPEATTLNTREQYLGHLRRFFEFCRKNNWIPVNPCRDIGVRTDGLTQEQLVVKKRPPFTDAEIATLLSNIPRDQFWHGAVLLARDFAPRIRDVALLEWSSLPEMKRLKIFTSKGKTVVDQPLSPDVAAWFSARPRIGDSGYVFPEQAARAMDASLGKLSNQFSAICARLGMGGKTFHCFRNTLATKKFDAILETLGGDQKAVLSALVAEHGMKGIQKLLGHISGSSVTAGRYYNPTPPPTSAPAAQNPAG